MHKLLISLVIGGFSSALVAAPVAVEGLRVWEGPDSTRVVFDLSAPVEHSVFSLENPNRIVIDLSNARMGSSVVLPEATARVAQVRSAPREKSDLRVVFDLAEKLKPKSFVVKPNGEYGHRLVLDLETLEPKSKADEPVKLVTPEGRELVIAIDAGHGGEDPGALGRRGTREKDVALQIARELARQINAEPGMRSVLIRDGDYFIPLRERPERARRAGADMFISVH
ncbi:MAG: N-acetylmuramoyl-L-alanine amidase, partial [Proteobacteria bacterium]|nr:N-acetylmuramoyl-L-alanine amidase [Pseudomonadota bacterium]